MPAAFRVIVSGLVQGVYFRAFAERSADRLGVSGSVRNLPDGTVEVIAEGDKQLLDMLLDDLRMGPPSARVERVEVELRKPTGQFAGFRIR